MLSPKSDHPIRTPSKTSHQLPRVIPCDPLQSSEVTVAIVALVGTSIGLASDVDLGQGTLKLGRAGLIQPQEVGPRLDRAVLRVLQTHNLCMTSILEDQLSNIWALSYFNKEVKLVLGLGKQSV